MIYFSNSAKDIDVLSNGELYDEFAYHFTFLRDFLNYNVSEKGNSESHEREPSSVHGGRVWESFNKKKEQSIKSSQSDFALNKSAHV